MKRLTIALFLVVLAACSKPPEAAVQTQSTTPNRFALERVSTIQIWEASSGSQLSHEVFIITDTKTGVQYVGIQSVGLCRLEDGTPKAEGYSK